MESEVVIAIVAVAVSGLAIFVSMFTWKKTRPIEKLQVEMSSQEYSRDSLLECFSLLSDPEVHKAKKIIADMWRAEKNGHPTMMPSNYDDRVRTVTNAYDQTCALYELGLLDQDKFDYVYGGAVVSTWKLVKDTVEKWRKDSGNREICKHFGNVESLLRHDKNFDTEPY